MQSILGQVAELSKYKRLWECFRLFFPTSKIFFFIALSATKWKLGTSFSWAASSGECESWTGYLGIHGSKHPHVLSNRWGLGSKQWFQHFCAWLSSSYRAFSSVKVFLKSVFFLFFLWPLVPMLDHVLFTIEKLVCIIEVFVFSSQSSFLVCLLYEHLLSAFIVFFCSKNPPQAC